MDMSGDDYSEDEVDFVFNHAGTIGNIPEQFITRRELTYAEYVNLMLISGENSNRSNPSRIVLGDPDRVVVPPVLTEPVTHYDQNLITAHQYLGDGLCKTTGRTIFEEGIIHTIPVIFLKLNLIPGQILPIIARSSEVQLVLKYALSRNRSFGVSYKLNENARTFGTIAEIYEHSSNIENGNLFKIKAMGHQRYEILSLDKFPESSEQSIALAKIKILADITLTHPFNKFCLHPRKRNSNHSDMCRKKDMWQTQWPDWVYKQFDVYQLASRLTEKVKMLYKTVKISDDPSLLSFQVTRLGIFNPEQVSSLLGIETTNLRLQYELQYWNQNQSMQKFECAHPNCHATICNMSSIFSMSPEGPQGIYCSYWGQIHDMITVTELHNVITFGAISFECSWFPGYKWAIILCSNCHNHLGWSYVADDNLSLIPRLFYGLSMRSITSISGS